MKRKSIAANIAESNEIGFDLLISDARMALTLLDLADSSENPDDQARRVGEAQNAYRTILHLRTKISPTQEQDEELSDALEALKTRLHQ